MELGIMVKEKCDTHLDPLTYIGRMLDYASVYFIFGSWTTLICGSVAADESLL